MYPGDAALPEPCTATSPSPDSGSPIRPERPGTRGRQSATLLRQAGFGFLVLANGKLDKEILAAARSGTTPARLGQRDAAAAVAAARREGFPPQTILFLDQEEGGRMLPEQTAYLLAWTEAVATTAFRPGVYASGQPVPDGTGPNGRPVTITTVEDLRAHVAAGRLHPIAFWAAQDACPPAPGCVLQPPPLAASGTVVLNSGGDLVAWQYAQSPRRPDITRACAATYAADGNCYSPAPARFFIDLSSSASPDPSHGR